MLLERRLLHRQLGSGPRHRLVGVRDTSRRHSRGVKGCGQFQGKFVEIVAIFATHFDNVTAAFRWSAEPVGAPLRSMRLLVIKVVAWMIVVDGDAVAVPR